MCVCYCVEVSCFHELMNIEKVSDNQINSTIELT